MLLIGLTGGIASGKTLVSDGFASLGAPIVDADILARKVVEPGHRGLEALTDHFGQKILSNTGELNRAALRNIVFSNPDERVFLDQTLHPLIRELSDEHIAAARQNGHPYLIYAVPLLVETRQQSRFDRIAVVDVSKAVQLERLLRRDNSSEEQAQAILAAQASREARLAVADDVIDNSGAMENTKAQVGVLHEKYRAMGLNQGAGSRS